MSRKSHFLQMKLNGKGANMLRKKMLRTFWLYKVQFISMILMVMLGIGMFTCFNIEWKSIEYNMFSLFKNSNYADYRLINSNGFSEEDLNNILDIKGVKNASRFITINADVNEKSGDTVAISITTNFDVSSFVLIDGEKYNKNSDDGIWLSDQYAKKNKISIGDSLSFTYNNIKLKGRVRGLIKAGEQMICVSDKTQIMPDFKSHGFAYISPALYEETLGFPYYPNINVLSNIDAKTFSKEADKALGNTNLIIPKEDTLSYSQAEGEVSEGKAMGSILPALFLLIALLTMISTMHRLTVKEKSQIGTLKALGFHDSKIILHYTSLAFIISSLGSILGIALGYFLAWIIMNPKGMMGTYLDLPEWKLVSPWYCYPLIIIIIFTLTFIGYLSVRNMLKGTASEALSPYIPKKVKPMLIEKTKIFKLIPFGTRWNLRDVVRHKTRTAMSLVGIIGCTIITIASFGIKETMNDFLDVYYENGLNYSSKIYLSENASDDERFDIIKRYNGDYGASTNVKLKEKNVNLDIYNLENGKIQTIDKNSKQFKIKNDGAYICMRISEKFNLHEGDTFSISPYGGNEKFDMVVNGIFRSTSENIIISDKYAQKLNIPYKIDSVYTDVKKGDIELSNNIKSVHSKKMIMDSFEVFLSIMNNMLYLYVAGALVLGVIVLYNLGTMSYVERYREMATLKVVGFRDNKIGKILYNQNLLISIIGIIIGIPLGILTLSSMLKSLASEYEMKMSIGIPSYLFTIILTLSMSLFVSGMIARKNRKIDMVEALKYQE